MSTELIEEEATRKVPMVENREEEGDDEWIRGSWEGCIRLDPESLSLFLHHNHHHHHHHHYPHLPHLSRQSVYSSTSMTSTIRRRQRPQLSLCLGR